VVDGGGDADSEKSGDRREVSVLGLEASMLAMRGVDSFGLWGRLPVFGLAGSRVGGKGSAGASELRAIEANGEVCFRETMFSHSAVPSSIPCFVRGEKAGLE